MKKENFSELTTEDLIKKRKTTTMLTGLLAGMLSVLLIMAVFQTINKEFSYLLIVPLGFLPMLFMNYNMVGNINKELKSRNDVKL